MTHSLQNVTFMPIGMTSKDPVRDLEEVQRELSVALPTQLCEILSEVGRAVMFDGGAYYKPDQCIGIEDHDGTQELLMLYGLVDDDNGLREANRTFRDQIPMKVLVIGEAPGGNQICIAIGDGSVILWNHEAPTDLSSISRIASNFGEFLSRLRRREKFKKEELKIVSSRLDF